MMLRIVRYRSKQNKTATFYAAVTDTERLLFAGTTGTSLYLSIRESQGIRARTGYGKAHKMDQCRWAIDNELVEFNNVDELYALVDTHPELFI